MRCSLQTEIPVRMLCRIVNQHQMRGIAVRFQCASPFAQLGKIVVAEDIAVDHGERFVTQQVQCVCDAAGGFQRLAFGRILNARAEPAAVAQCGFDLRAEVGMVDHQFANARPHQIFDVPDDQRFAGDFQQRFWGMVGERAHAFAAAGCQYHCDHGVTSFTFALSPASGGKVDRGRCAASFKMYSPLA